MQRKERTPINLIMMENTHSGKDMIMGVFSFPAVIGIVNVVERRQRVKEALNNPLQ